MVADHAHLKGDAGGFRVTDGGICPWIRERHHKVRLNGGLFRQAPAVGFAGKINIFAIKCTVRSGKINKFKYAKGPLAGIRGFYAFNPVLTDNDNFSGIEFTHKFSFDKIKSTGFRSQYITAVQFTKAQRPETIRVFDTDNFTPASQHYKWKGPLQPGYGFNECFFESMFEAFYEKVQKDLAVHRGLENRAGFFKLIFQGLGIDNVAIVGHGIGFFSVAHHKGLGIGQYRAARSGIACVADSAAPFQLLQDTHVENIWYQPHAFISNNRIILDGRNSGTFLPPMLQGV